MKLMILMTIHQKKKKTLKNRKYPNVINTRNGKFI